MLRFGVNFSARVLYLNEKILRIFFKKVQGLVFIRIGDVRFRHNGISFDIRAYRRTGRGFVEVRGCFDSQHPMWSPKPSQDYRAGLKSEHQQVWLQNQTNKTRHEIHT